MFEFIPENPRSMVGATFVFTFTQSFVCPTVFIMGNRRMRRYVGRKICNFGIEFTVSVINVFKRAFKRNVVEPFTEANNEMNVLQV